MKKWISLFSSIVLILVFFSGCTGGKAQAEFQPGENLLVKGDVEITGGELSANGFRGRQGAAYTVRFAQPKQLNTVILREQGSHASGFTIEAMLEGSYQTIYEQDDKIGAYRYCAFPRITTEALRITLLHNTEQVKLTSVEAYDVAAKRAEDFRVTTYVTVEQAYHKNILAKQAGSLEVITDIIFFGSARFDENGELSLNDIEIDGEKLDGKTAFTTAVANLKELIGNRPIHLYCNFIGPSAPEGTPDEQTAKRMNELHSHAMQEKRSALIGNLLEFTKENGFTGIFFDYEYPHSVKAWNVFADFLEELRAQTNGMYRLGAAMPAWKHVSIPKVLKNLDLVEIMGYDSFDDAGYHASFANTASDLVKTYRDMNAAMEKVDLGMPFYARPTDGASFWFDYSWEAHKLGKSHNVATGPMESADWSDGGRKKTRDVPRYYNGYQMIYDKTAYAIDAGLGGVMTWNYGYDLPFEDELSLFRAIQQAVQDRTT